LTREEKLNISKENMRKAKQVLGTDPRLTAFMSRRKLQSSSPRFWALLGHELPKKRKIFKVLLSST